MKGRVLYLDVLRIIACLMVLMMHAPMPGELASHHGPFLGSTTYLVSPCVPIFFMVSGALLLPMGANFTAVQFLRKRLKHVVIPTLIFTLLYIALSYNDLGGGGVLKSILSIPFSWQGAGPLWFMYPLIGLYLLTPIISPWIRTASKQTLQLYLLIWSITLLYPILSSFLDINESPKGILYYFSGFAGFFLLGYYMNKYPVSLKWLVPLALLMPLCYLVLKYLDLKPSIDKMYLNLPVALMTAAWFGVVKYLCRKSKNESPRIILLSKLTFGVYLIHHLTMRVWIWKWPIIEQMTNYYLQTFAVFTLSTVISFFAVWLISKLPFSKYIVGA